MSWACKGNAMRAQPDPRGRPATSGLLSAGAGVTTVRNGPHQLRIAESGLASIGPPVADRYSRTPKEDAMQRESSQTVRSPRARTKRLELIAGTSGLVRAQISNRERFARLLEARVPRAREQEPDHQETMKNVAQALEKRPEQVGWWCWYFVLHNRVTGHRVLIGNGGFKGPPADDGTVEIGYSLLQPYRNRGYTAEAVKALVSWAFQHPQVTRVIAEAQLGNTASIRVLQKAGFTEVGPGSQRSLVRFEMARQDFRS